MATWSLLVASFGGPGYVSNYFKAEVVEGQYLDTDPESFRRDTQLIHRLLYDPTGSGNFFKGKENNGEEEESLLAQSGNKVVAHFTYPSDESERFSTIYEGPDLQN